ncbi:hypothetical protein C5167_013618 [Papaver somniferum]|uniref:Uncharacterized protein n=1 Tax=Papaver somniferum TaxID=3469 RepID=A0A4Y7J0U7_PAPSO|nr:hypothetical protein C5167_013618 [Papaver somniferum]
MAMVPAKKAFHKSAGARGSGDVGKSNGNGSKSKGMEEANSDCDANNSSVNVVLHVGLSFLHLGISSTPAHSKLIKTSIGPVSLNAYDVRVNYVIKFTGFKLSSWSLSEIIIVVIVAHAFISSMQIMTIVIQGQGDEDNLYFFGNESVECVV